MRVAGFALLLLIATACGGGGDDRTPAELAREGRTLYESSCAACHGMDLKGTDGGPSFLNTIYAPNHHPDEAFHRAAKDGVQQHHWSFGDMPAQPRFSEADINAIIAYVRSEQREAGITNDPTH
jgi:mono/diheme cytochrome c family protein